MDREKNEDEKWMLLALKEAEKGGVRGEVPVGAVVVLRGKVVGRAFNRPIGKNDPTAHAEVLAIRQAARRAGNYRLVGCELYVTLEPCAMCLGAAVQARVSRLVYGASDSKHGAVASLMRFPFDRMNHRPEIRNGVRAAECRRLLMDFFRNRRRNRAAG
ncbi:MAG: tRNA-specific adenosine deaminase [Candidatus Aminicenantes bacterium RBG_13_63_10]|nr:MAG: tRNA-specific adenosine deaminase [Candidatus Aminicenantes bacterium RBG_13_63_10]